MRLDEGLSLISSYDCFLFQKKCIVSSQYPYPTIIDQYPCPESKVKAGQAIFVTVGQPSPKVLMPNFVGKSELQVKALAENSSMYIHIKRIFYDGQEGVCCGQFPAAGIAFCDQLVIIYITEKYNNRCVMPILINKEYQDVKLSLMKRDIIVHCNNLVDSDNRRYYIEDQFPAPGTLIRIKKGFVVNVKLAV